MINIAIVEDEEEFQDMFSSYVKRYADEHGLKTNVTVFGDGLDITEGYEPVWDIILLDIRMKHQDGMSAARLIREHDENVVIMFITTLAQYAIYGYEVDAIDYLLKPVEYEKFAFRFQKAIRHIAKDEDAYLLLPAEDGKDKVNIKSILYARVEHHNLEIHVKRPDGEKITYTMRRSIGSLEDELKEYDFFRCDQSVLVSLRAVTKVLKDGVEADGEYLPVSHPRRKAFLNALAAYIG